MLPIWGGGPFTRRRSRQWCQRDFSWTGCYIGGNIGWGWGRDTVSIPDLGATTGVLNLSGVSLGPVTGNTTGVLGGGQVGCNYQFAPNWVIGIEGDGEAANIKGDATETVSLVTHLPSRERPMPRSIGLPASPADSVGLGIA
jgi:hypothetical protein